MDKDNLDIKSLVARFNAEPLSLKKESSSQKDAPQKLLMAIFFMVVGLILIATGFISLLFRLVGMMQFPLLWGIQRIKARHQISTGLLQRPKHL